MRPTIKTVRNSLCPKRWGDQESSLLGNNASRHYKAFSVHRSFVASSGKHRPNSDK
jgi:hypothetical protein